MTKNFLLDICFSNDTIGKFSIMTKIYLPKISINREKSQLMNFLPDESFGTIR